MTIHGIKKKRREKYKHDEDATTMIERYKKANGQIPALFFIHVTVHVVCQSLH